jgi:outer membrane protein assembly factor BamB
MTGALHLDRAGRTLSEEQQMLRFTTAIRTAMTLSFLLPAVLRADDWPQWRGPERDGVWRENGLLRSFPKDGLKVRWRAPVGWGFSSPVVARGRVYLADSKLVKPRAQERLQCLDETTGKVLWIHAYDVAYEDWAFDPEQEIGPVATPIVRAGKVYTLGRLGHLFCLDAQKGAVLWQRNLQQDYQVAFAPGTPSPLIDNNLLILFIGGKPGACVAAFHKDNGKEVWKALDEALTFSSPIVVASGGNKQLIVWTQESVISLNPATGKTWWRQRLATSKEFAVSTPVYLNDRLLIGGLMFQLDPAKPEAKVLWPDSKAPSRRILSHTSTALLHGAHLFSARSSGELICLDATTGSELWSTAAVTDLKNGASIHLTQNGDSFLLYTDKGELIRAQLTAKGYKEISRARVVEPTMPFAGRKVAWAPPAYANGHIFARTGTELVCASLQGEPAQQYQALLKQRQDLPDELSKARTQAERQQVLARLASLPQHFLELAEKSPEDPVALPALTQTVEVVNGMAFPAGGTGSPGHRALAILARDHVKSDKLGPVCQQVVFGFHKSHETFLRAVLERNPHRDVQGLACLSLAQFLNNRLHRLNQVRDQDGPELAQRYYRVFGREYIEALLWQDRAQLAGEAETLFVRAGNEYGDVKIPVTFVGTGGTVAEKANAELFQIRNLAVGKSAQDIHGQDQDGKRFKLTDYRGKVVLLDFWYHL